MPAQIDVYRDWLGVQEAARPLNHYQVLRLKPFEDRQERIRDNYRKMNAHVRKQLAGEHAARARTLLAELAGAMMCLADARRKQEYDVSLGRKDAGPQRRQKLEEILLARQAITNDQLDKARKFAAAVGVEMRDALLQQKLATADVVMPAYAESMGLPYVDLSEQEIDPALAAKMPTAVARDHACVPLVLEKNLLVVASPNQLSPEVEEELRMRFGAPVRTAICTAGHVHDMIEKHFPRDGAGAASRATAPVAAEVEEGPPDPEAANKRKWTTIIAFNFAFMAVMMGMSLFTESMLSLSGLFLSLVLAALVGGAAAGIAWKYAEKR